MIRIVQVEGIVFVNNKKKAFSYLIVPKGGKVIFLNIFREKPYVLQIVLRNFAP